MSVLTHTHTDTHTPTHTHMKKGRDKERECVSINSYVSHTVMIHTPTYISIHILFRIFFLFLYIHILGFKHSGILHIQNTKYMPGMREEGIGWGLDFRV